MDRRDQGKWEQLAGGGKDANHKQAGLNDDVGAEASDGSSVGNSELPSTNLSLWKFTCKLSSTGMEAFYRMRVSAASRSNAGSFLSLRASLKVPLCYVAATTRKM